VPKISVVIATRNAAQLISKTLGSIACQSYDNLEVIIVDGQSTDNTIDVVSQYDDHIDKVICEQDDGIFDAWNKAIPFITGEWVQFLGAGDEIHNSATMADVAQALGELDAGTEFVYGNLSLISDRGKLIEKIVMPSEYIGNKFVDGRPITPIHPEALVRRDMLLEFGFDSTYKYAGDLKFMLTCFARSKPAYLNIDIAMMLFGGQSSSKKNIPIIQNEVRRIKRELAITIPWYVEAKHYISSNLTYWLYKLLPDSVFTLLVNVKHRLVGVRPF
jgi:glycosyltransferase involved in cell wall biosynthesis